MSKYELERLETEELESILRMDAIGQGEGTDEETIWSIMEILAERRREKPEREFPGVEQSWNTFREKYGSMDHTTIPVKRKAHKPFQLKYFAGMAAAIVLCCSALSINASSHTIWEEIAQWTEDTFSFTNPYQSRAGNVVSEETGQSSINDYGSLQEALAHYDIEGTLVPQWIPERFRLALIQVDEANEDIYMEAQYINRDELLVISIHHIVTGKESVLFKDNTPVSVCTIGGIDHYIMSYEQTNTAAWMNGQNECVIAGNISQEELEQMLQSVYQGEG
ncbi:MAG: DUF4367 domain-containing protein [Eubacteriales bacterium]|nr:DUF4367 domain-containing protein [Eubacteriales bacterium]